VSLDSPPKDAVKQRAGAIGAAKRWGPRRVVRLAELHPSVAAAVRALIEADAAAKGSEPPGSGQE
jgi:hypothetical protein